MIRAALSNKQTGSMIMATRHYRHSFVSVLKLEATARPPLGTVTGIKPRGMTKTVLRGVVLRTAPDTGLVHLISFDPYPHLLLRQQTVDTSLLGNAFQGYRFLNAATGKKIMLLVRNELTAPLGEMACALKERRNEVITGVISTPPAPDFSSFDLIFAAGGANEIKKVVNQLPPSFKGKIILWYLH